MVLFFFIRRIPFAVINSWAFHKFVSVPNPAYEKKMPHSSALRTAHLADMYDETAVETTEMLAARPGKITLGIDGFKDVRGRHVMNISETKVGVATYRTAEWLGARRHTGETYFNAC